MRVTIARNLTPTDRESRIENFLKFPSLISQALELSENV